MNSVHALLVVHSLLVHGWRDGDAPFHHSCC